jgi:large subunit ribosomal protein L11
LQASSSCRFRRLGDPSPPIGPALGQRGINIMEFCKAFNAQTQEMEKGSPIPVVITYYQDKSFTFVMKTPPVSYFLKKAANLKSGSKEPGKVKAGTMTKAQVREIAEKKMKDLNANDVEARCAWSKAPPARWAWKWWAEIMAKIAKRVAKSREGIDRNKLYALGEAVKMLKERARPSSTRPSRSR